MCIIVLIRDKKRDFYNDQAVVIYDDNLNDIILCVDGPVRHFG